jgi:hypothetical protein
VDTIVGSIGGKGTTKKTITVRPPDYVTYVASDGEGGDDVQRVYYEASYVTFLYQDTPSSYKKIVVNGLIHYNYVYGNYKVETTLADSSNSQTNFVIPLQYNLVQQLPLIKRNFLYRDAFQLVFYSHEAVKVKWYESNFFQFLMVVVAIAWLVWSGDFTALEAAATGGAYTLAMYFIEQIVISFVWSEGFKVLADAIGAEWATAIAALISISVQQGWLKADSLKGLPFAEEILAGSSAAFSGITEYINSEYETLNNEIKEFDATKEKLIDELEAANELLETSGFIDPFEFINLQGSLSLGESPTDYYNRTVHSGNVGILSLDSIEYFTEIMLQLPDIRKTLIGDTLSE